MVILVFFNVLKIANVRPLVGQKGPYNPTKGSGFYNNSFKNWLQDNGIVMYSKHNEGKSVVAERFIKMLKNKIYKYVTSISKNLYIDKLDDIVNEYNNTYHRTIKTKPTDVKD